MVSKGKYVNAAYITSAVIWGGPGPECQYVVHVTLTGGTEMDLGFDTQKEAEDFLLGLQ